MTFVLAGLRLLRTILFWCIVAAVGTIVALVVFIPSATTAALDALGERSSGRKRTMGFWYLWRTVMAALFPKTFKG